MNYAIIGAEGQVGQEFSKFLSDESLISLAHDKIDVTDAASVARCLASIDCSILINLAAFHNVNACEQDRLKAFQVNAVGAANVAEAAARKGCKVVYFSSDYVFGMDTDRRRPYVECDPAGPLNAYGASKVAGEQLTCALHRDHLIVRTSSLFGVTTSKKGWTFPEMIIARANAVEPLRVVNDQHMAPTYTFDLVQTVIRLIEADVRGIVHVTSGGCCTWYEFAKMTLKLAGIDHPITPVPSDAFPSVASRPAYSVLKSEILAAGDIPAPRNWADALRAYLKERRIVS